MRVKEIKKEAKDRFALNRYHAMLIYGVVFTVALNIAVLTTALCLLNIWAVWYGVFLIFMFLLMLAPFGYSMAGFYIRLYRFEKIDAFHVFDGFNKYNLERVIILRLLSFMLWLCFTVLLIVPGIIFRIRTCVATYILRANPDMKPKDALKASSKVMKGHCWKFFCLSLSFIGWFVMGILTCGFGFIWVMPYFNTSKIVFYKRELEGDKKVYVNPLDPKQRVEASETQSVAEISTETTVHNEQTVINSSDSRQTIYKKEPLSEQLQSDVVSAPSEELLADTDEESAQSDKVADIPILDIEQVKELHYSGNTAEQPETPVSCECEHTESNRISGETESVRSPARERQHDALSDSRFNRVSSRPLGGGRVVMDENGQRLIRGTTPLRESERESRVEPRTSDERRERPRFERPSARGERERNVSERRSRNENIVNKINSEIGEDGK